MTALLAWGDQWAPTPEDRRSCLSTTLAGTSPPCPDLPALHAEVSAANTHGQPGLGSNQPPLRVQASEGVSPAPASTQASPHAGCR